MDRLTAAEANARAAEFDQRVPGFVPLSVRYGTDAERVEWLLGALPQPCGNCGRPRWECACDGAEARLSERLGEEGIKPGDMFAMVDGWAVPLRLSSVPASAGAEGLREAVATIVSDFGDSEDVDGWEVVAALRRALAAAPAPAVTDPERGGHVSRSVTPGPDPSRGVGQ